MRDVVDREISWDTLEPPAREFPVPLCTKALVNLYQGTGGPTHPFPGARVASYLKDHCATSYVDGNWLLVSLKFCSLLLTTPMLANATIGTTTTSFAIMDCA
jgi:hypothetical protein